MKRTLFLSVLFGMLLVTAHAENESHQQVDSTLYAYYRWCNNNIRDTAVLSKADTLFRLSGEKHDIRMQAVALSMKADHYYFNNDLDSLKAWIPRVQDFARKHNQLKYYYFTWSRLILYYTKQAQYTLAQYELEQYMSQAEKDNYKPATADAYKQLGHIYRTRGLKEASVEYYRKAIDFMIQNGLDKFQLSNLYSELATMLMDLRRYPEAAEAIEKGKACIPLPEYIWSLKIKEVLLLLQTDQIAKAKALFEEIKAGHGGYLTDINLTEIQLAIYKSSHEYTKALATIERLIGLFGNEGYAESYFYYIYKTRADAYAALGNFGPAYEDLQHFIDLYHKRVNDDNEKTLGEFATLLDVNRLNVEKAELHQQAQEERLHRTQLGTIGLACILLLAAVFIAVMLRMNRHLARAKRAAEESNRMKGIFIRNITHEINTPLNSIVGFAELAAASDDADAAERQSYIGIIQENSGYLQKLVDDVLYVAGLESSETPPVMGADRDQRMLPGVHSEGLAVQPPGGRHPFRPGMREIPPAHLPRADIQSHHRNAAQCRALRGRRRYHARLHARRRQPPHHVHGNRLGPRHPGFRGRAYFRPLRQTRHLLAGAWARADGMPADRLSPERHDKTRHGLQRRGTFRTFDTATLNTKNQHNRPYTGKLI